MILPLFPSRVRVKHQLLDHGRFTSVPHDLAPSQSRFRAFRSMGDPLHNFLADATIVVNRRGHILAGTLSFPGKKKSGQSHVVPDDPEKDSSTTETRSHGEGRLRRFAISAVSFRPGQSGKWPLVWRSRELGSGLCELPKERPLLEFESDDGGRAVRERQRCPRVRNPAISSSGLLCVSVSRAQRVVKFLRRQWMGQPIDAQDLVCSRCSHTSPEITTLCAKTPWEDADELGFAQCSRHSYSCRRLGSPDRRHLVRAGTCTGICME